MFDLGQQGENAVRTEGGPAACERALMRAVLEDAIRCLVGEVGPPHQRGALAAEAREWIETADPRWPFSFENLCDGLGLEAANLRRRLLRDAPAPAPALRDASAPTRQPGPRGRRARRASAGPRPRHNGTTGSDSRRTVVRARRLRCGSDLQPVAQSYMRKEPVDGEG